MGQIFGRTENRAKLWIVPYVIERT